MKKVKSLIAGKRLTYVAPSTTVSEAAALMTRARIGAVVVLDNGQLAGIFTERDLLDRVVAKSKDPRNTKISDVMTTDVTVANTNDSYEDCLAKMRQLGCRHLPLVDGDQLVGVISIRDLLLHDISVKEDEIKMMHSLYYYNPSQMEE